MKVTYGYMEVCATCGHPYEVPPPSTIEGEALHALAGDLTGATEDCWRFFRTLWSPSAGYPTVRHLAGDLAVYPQTLWSRFARAGLPSPKRYIVNSRLVRAARMLENPRTTFTRVAYDLGAPSPQAFTRVLREETGLTARQFRSRYDGSGMLDVFRSELVLLYRVRLALLAPLVGRYGQSLRVSVTA